MLVYFYMHCSHIVSICPLCVAPGPPPRVIAVSNIVLSNIVFSPRSRTVCFASTRITNAIVTPFIYFSFHINSKAAQALQWRDEKAPSLLGPFGVLRASAPHCTIG